MSSPERTPSAPPVLACRRCGTATANPFAGAGGVCLRCAGERAFALGSATPFEADSPSPASDAPAAAVSDSDLPARIGLYDIIEELGRGGMGRVFAARQRGLGRIVALKVLPVGAGAPVELEMRFLREAQTVARLRHPHIVAIHDSGRAAGHVYFSMDYVADGDLGRALRARAFAPRETAMLVAKVADALAHAHAEGVLHRDLKPSNILLDGDEPRLADFGLATQLETSGDFTSPSGVFGTPHYLAPEALRGGAIALTPASDLYALGVVLYTMLTGRTPFAGASPAELAALVNENDPPAVHLLAPAVPRDLETIAMKCLERDPARRYASAAALAVDLRCWLAGEPIAAQPPGRAERFRRFALRHRGPLIASGVVALLLAAAAIGGTSLAVRANRAEKFASAEAATARAVVAFLKEDLLGVPSQITNATGGDADPNLKLRAVVDRAAAKVAGRFTADPQVEMTIQETLGATYSVLGEFTRAHTHLARAHVLALQLHGADASRTLEIEQRLGDALLNLGRYAESNAVKTALLERARRLHGPEDPAALSLASDVGIVRLRMGRASEAEALIAGALKVQERVIGPDHPEAIAAMNNLGLVYDHQGRAAEAGAIYARGLEHARRTLGNDHGLTTALMNNLGFIYINQGKPDAAEALLVEVMAARQRQLGPEHPLTLTAMNSLGVTYRTQKRLPEAEKLLASVAETRRRVLTPDHPATLSTDNALAATYREEGKFPEAIALFQSALERRSRLLSPEHPDTLRTMHALAQTYAAQGDKPAAVALFTRTVELRRRVLSPTHPDTLASEAALARLTASPSR